MEESDATASPNTESPSETGDSEAELKYSLSGDSCSDSSHSNSSSLHEVSVCALNGTQNVDLTIQRENRKQRAENRKEL